MLLVSMILDCSKGIVIDTIAANNEESAIENMLIKHNLLQYQVNQLCITNIDTQSKI